MAINSVPKDIEQLLSEADKLIKKIDSHEVENMQEEHRIDFEKHAQSLKKLRAEVQEKIGNRRAQESGSPSEGMHEAILDIMKAMKKLGGYLA